MSVFFRHVCCGPILSSRWEGLGREKEDAIFDILILHMYMFKRWDGEGIEQANKNIKPSKCFSLTLKDFVNPICACVLCVVRCTHAAVVYMINCNYCNNQGYFFRNNKHATYSMFLGVQENHCNSMSCNTTWPIKSMCKFWGVLGVASHRICILKLKPLS